MALSKRLCPTSDQQIRQSFDERICDDLCEDILQYLPLKDKLKLECVSKQFQRTLFVKQHELKHREIVWITNIITFDEKLEDFLHWNDNRVLDSVLKKCPKVNSMDFDIRKAFIDYFNRYCLNSDEGSGYLIIEYKMTENLANKLNKKSLVLNLKTCMNLFSYERGLSSLTDIKALHIKCLEPFGFLRDSLPIHFHTSVECLYPLKNLKTVSTLLETHDFDYFETLIQNNQSLEKLDIQLMSKNSKEIEVMFSQISKLKDLVELKVLTPNGLCGKTFVKGLKGIAISCPHLKSIYCNAFVYKDLELRGFYLSPLKSLKQLKRLHLNIRFELEDGFFSFEFFRGFQHLTHLTLSFNNYHFIEVGQLLIKDIDINLPNLQYLEVICRIRANGWAIDILSRLSRLETIKLNVVDGITDQTHNFRRILKKRLLENCKNIRTIQLDLFEHN